MHVNVISFFLHLEREKLFHIFYKECIRVYIYYVKLFEQLL